MKRLFIIGNGFDIAHGLPTKYDDFKEYVKRRYPNYINGFDGVIETIFMPDGEEVYDMDKVVGLLFNVFDEIAGKDWSALERSLGDAVLTAMINQYEWEFKEINVYIDGEPGGLLYSNVDVSMRICGAFFKLKELFEEWVYKELSIIDYKKITAFKDRPPFEDALFLNFNYTHTLEEVYGIKEENILHIHGDCLNKGEQIIFGHGDEVDYHEDSPCLGIEPAFIEFNKNMKKDVESIIINNCKFFRGLRDIDEIYTYGFSFSDVDEPYIREICKSIDKNKVIWFFNNWDFKNHKEYMAHISKRGIKTDKYEW